MSRKIALMFLVLAVGLMAQDAKTGWGFGGVPAVAYNSDTGFLYGIVFEAYNYGDGAHSPDYDYTIKPTWTRTTKGSGANELFFDSKYLLPGDVRITAYAGYLTEQALPFYGFNGYEAGYTPGFENADSSNYITRMYYRHERNTLRLTADFQKSVLSENLRAIGGFGYIRTEVAPVDIEVLNEDQEDADKLPDVDALYDEYVANGYIGTEEADGGLTPYIKLGLVYDTRDNEPNPMSGVWTEALFTPYPGFMGSDFGFSTFTATHRQYFTLIENDLSFAYRVGYQQNFGETPFFMLPWYQSSYKVTEGLGGSKSLRGILKNRIVGNSIVLANMEARWKFFRTVVGGQNLYLALNAFGDFGQVMTPYEVEGQTLPLAEDEGLHVAFGGGLRIVLNQNFIIAVDQGYASDPQDGTSGLYIGLGYLY